MEEGQQVIVVGAGAAGLGVAAELNRRGVPALVLERSDGVASSWRSRYDSLILNTPRITSTLAGYRIPRRYGRWPSRDAIVEYLEEYARRHELELRFGIEVERLERQNGSWTLRTSDGELRAPQVVIATGHDTHPLIPDWPGRDDFPGELIHSAAYRNPAPFQGREVLVASANNSGSEIAFELATSGAARVWTAMRTPPNVFPREWPRGVPLNITACALDHTPDRFADVVAKVSQRMIYGNLAKHGLPKPPIGAQTRTKRDHKSSLIDAGFVKALKEGRLEIVSAVEAFEGAELVLADGSRLRPEVVIAATGYERGLVPLVGHLGVLDAKGHPKELGGRAQPGAPGLYFNGFYATISGQLRYMRKHARAIARAIARERKTAGAPAPVSEPTSASV
jgi:putative flavoprotein involved in K+ transport